MEGFLGKTNSRTLNTPSSSFFSSQFYLLNLTPYWMEYSFSQLGSAAPCGFASASWVSCTCSLMGWCKKEKRISFCVSTAQEQLNNSVLSTLFSAQIQNAEVCQLLWIKLILPSLNQHTDSMKCAAFFDSEGESPKSSCLVLMYSEMVTFFLVKNLLSGKLYVQFFFFFLEVHCLFFLFHLFVLGYYAAVSIPFFYFLGRTLSFWPISYS